MSRRVSWGVCISPPGCEMQLSALPQNFGTRALSIQDPDLKRPTNIETSIAIQHELMPGLSVGAGYYRRTFQNLLQTDFVDRSQADYSPVQVVSPLNGEVITAYNLAPAKLHVDADLRHERHVGPQADLQRLRVRDERARARRDHGVWRVVFPEDGNRDLRPAGRSEPAAVLRSARERAPIRH